MFKSPFPDYCDSCIIVERITVAREENNDAEKIDQAKEISK